MANKYSAEKIRIHGHTCRRNFALIDICLGQAFKQTKNLYIQSCGLTFLKINSLKEIIYAELLKIKFCFICLLCNFEKISAHKLFFLKGLSSLQLGLNTSWQQDTTNVRPMLIFALFTCITQSLSKCAGIHCAENPIYVFPEMKLRGLIPNFFIHVSVSDLYILRISLLLWLHLNRQTDPGNIKITHRYMNVEIGRQNIIILFWK